MPVRRQGKKTTLKVTGTGIVVASFDGGSISWGKGWGKERSNARLERLKRRGAARRARLEAQVEAAAAEPENPGVIVY